MDRERDINGRTPAEERADIGTPAGEQPESGRRRHGTYQKETADTYEGASGLKKGSLDIRDETTGATGGSGPSLDLDIEKDIGVIPGKDVEHYVDEDLEVERHSHTSNVTATPNRAVSVENMLDTDASDVTMVETTEKDRLKSKSRPARAAGYGLAEGGDEQGTGGRTTGKHAGTD